MIKEFCDRCGVEIIKGRSKNICFDGSIWSGFGKVGTYCLQCYKEIKEFATKTIPYRGKWGIIFGKNENKRIHNKNNNK